MSNSLFVLIPIIAALSGWLINTIFIKLIFYPAKPVSILGFTLQGILPKHLPTIGQQLGEYVSTHLFSLEAIEQKIADPGNIEKAIPFIETHVDHFLRVKLVEKMPIISMFIGEKTIADLKAVFIEEIKTLFPALMNHYMSNLKQEIDIEKMFTEKIAALDTNIIASAFFEQFSTALNTASIISALIGFVFGLLQLIVILLVK